MREVICYTDGSAVVRGINKGKGGFGTYFPDLNGKKKAYSLGFKQTKTGRMEICALLFAIRAVSKVDKISLVVYSDSEYVVKSFTENRLYKWIKAGWKNTSGDVANRDLWEKVLYEMCLRKNMKLEMRHIKSHQLDKVKDPEIKKELLNNPHIVGNYVADGLADYKRHVTLINTDLRL